MKESRKYYLVGMPSSGKSTVGKLLAGFLGLTFVDLDDVIVAEEGMEISEIFSSKGEPYFRELERDSLHDHINKEEGFVMATGGGTPCFFDNMNKMNLSGTTIFLKVDVDQLFTKLSKKGIQKRPLLKDKTLEELHAELKNKFEERRVYYEQAKIVLDQTFKDISDRTNEVLFAIRTLEK
ncbi:MAG TPA: shikimate kinase [Candidatus Limnocylindrales bacterium]|nr:shikimate kinase [Candidatus Limnocylindrales bacterium]